MRSRQSLAWVCLVTLLVGRSAVAQDPEAKPKLVVMPLQSSGLPQSAVTTLDELLAEFVRRLGKHQVIGKTDIDAMLGLENMKDQLGCADVTCAAQIGGALGAEFLVAGRVAKLGDNLIIVLKLLDARKQAVLNSVKSKSDDNENVYDKAIEEGVLQLFGLKAAPTAASTDADILRSFISENDWQRYLGHKTALGREVALADWVNQQNKESTPLFIGELSAGGLILLSATVPGLNYRAGGGDSGAPLLAIPGIVGLGVLLLIDVLDVGAVEVAR